MCLQPLSLSEYPVQHPWAGFNLCSAVYFAVKNTYQFTTSRMKHASIDFEAICPQARPQSQGRP